MSELNTRAIGLSLSGGGVRAIAFHAGVLRRLAELGCLGQVVHASTVSGGSLFTGLVFHFAGYRWPADDEYLRDVLPKLRELLTTSCLQSNALLRLAIPSNWRYLTSRANVFAQSIDRLWGISATLAVLPNSPVWSINGSTAESGRRFRFKSTEMGDYETGYAPVPHFPLAAAMAISAAFPGGIGPLAIATAVYQWTKKPSWNASDAQPHQPPFRTIHVYDGGVYDNLGLEPLFDMGTQAFRKPEKRKVMAPEIDFLVVSDAGLGFARAKLPHPLNPLRLKRVADVAFDQVRALRIRVLMNFFRQHPTAGTLLPIGTVVPDEAAMGFLSSQDCAAAAQVKTDLKKMKLDIFNLVERHGYETAHWATKKLIQAPDEPMPRPQFGGAEKRKID